jgi:hypothetical protein
MLGLLLLGAGALVLGAALLDAWLDVWLAVENNTISEDWNEGRHSIRTRGVWLERRPFVAQISHWSQRHGGMELAGLLRDYGYRVVKRDVLTDTTIWARPWPLWAFLRAAVKTEAACGSLAAWVYRRGLFHVVCPEYQIARWRDLRPGPRRRPQ